MQILVTRPDEDADELIAALKSRGVDSLHEPMISITYSEDAQVNFEGVQAVLATSANGIRALARLGQIPALPLYAVGDASAQTARSTGFSSVESADGDVQALVELVQEFLDPKAGAVVHPTGEQSAGNVKLALEAAGFEYRRYPLYEAVAERTLSPTLIAEIKAGQLDGVAFYSPRTAQIFIDLVRKSRLVRACRSLDAYCLSPAVADAAEKITWHEVHTATSPKQNSFLALFPDSNSGASAPSSEHHSPEPATSLPVVRRSNSVSMFFTNLLGFAVIAGAVAATAPLWTPHVAKLYAGTETQPVEQVWLDELSDRLAKLEAVGRRVSAANVKALEAEQARLQSQLDTALDRLKSLEKSLKAVRQVMTAVTNSSPSDSASAVLESLSERLDRLESGGETSSEESRELLTSLTGQVAKLETAIGDAKSDSRRNQALILSVGQLREAVRSSRPYLDELAALRVLVKDDAAVGVQLAILEHRSQQGVPNFQMLRARFDRAAGRLVRAEFVSDGDSWIERTIDRLVSSVRWRRTDNLEGAGVEAVVARADRKLQAADLAGAVQELEALSPKGIAAARPWMDDAAAFLSLERALATLQILAVSGLPPADR